MTLPPGEVNSVPLDAGLGDGAGCGVGWEVARGVAMTEGFDCGETEVLSSRAGGLMDPWWTARTP